MNFKCAPNDVQLYLSDDPCNLDECILRMNADLNRMYIWSAENGLYLNPEKSQVIVIGFPRFSAAAAAVQPVSIAIPFCTRVKSVRLTNNSRFAWDDQIDSVFDVFAAWFISRCNAYGLLHP
jgi:hypothetical protein